MLVCLSFSPTCLKFACNVWALGPHVRRCQLCAEVAPPNLAHLFGCDGFVGLLLHCLPRAAWAAGPRASLRALRKVRMMDNALQMRALPLNAVMECRRRGSDAPRRSTGSVRSAALPSQLAHGIKTDHHRFLRVGLKKSEMLAVLGSPARVAEKDVKKRGRVAIPGVCTVKTQDVSLKHVV